ncbi:MAG: 16S rRNA (guanine(527)-N(7))-methyltransferase RsmG [Kovacikia sp.]
MNEIEQSQEPILPEMAELWQQTLDWQPTDLQQLKFQQLYQQILAGNRQLNLTRITEPSEFWEKHLWDSLRGIFSPASPISYPPLPHLIDIGTGAGFPGLAVAIAQPAWDVTLLDSTRKKMHFLDHLLEGLEIPNAHTLVERVETVGQLSSHRQTYDIALVRAVATAPICAEYALPLLQPNGLAVLYRGQWTVEETVALEPVVKILGGTIAEIETFKTPLTRSDRHCLYLKKIAPTPPDFPRAVGIPTQKPLG